MEIIKSISYSQEYIINSILSLHNQGKQIDVDATYSKGNFYKGIIQQPLYKFDIEPQIEGVVKADCRHLPLSKESVECIMYDPPFLATTGGSLKKEDKSNIIAKRFGVYNSEKELHQFYIDSMKEFYRILKPNGILIFKCQDKISSGKQYMSHCFIMNEAVKLGFYPQDLFILLTKNRLVANWQARNQKNARKYHSYFWVFKKSNKQIDYI